MNVQKIQTNQFLKIKKKRKVKSLFIDNIWGADLADMQLLSKFNNGVRLLCITDIFSKYAWVIPLKDKKGISITNAFQKLFDESYRKPNKIRVLWMIHRLCVMQLQSHTMKKHKLFQQILIKRK